MSVIKSCCFSENVFLRATTVESLAPLLLRVWCALDSTPQLLEGRMQFESTIESRRHQEDMLEFLVDMYKNIALGVKGEAVGLELGQELVDNTRAEGACLAAMGLLLQQYNANHNSVLRRVDGYVTALLGQLPLSAGVEVVSVSVSVSGGANAPARSRELAGLRAASLSSLLQHLLPELLKDPYHLFHRATSKSKQEDMMLKLIPVLLC